MAPFLCKVVSHPPVSIGLRSTSKPWLAADANRARGEFVVVLHSLAKVDAAETAGAHDAVLVPLLAALPLKQAVALAAEISGASRNLLYARALLLKRAAPAENGPAH